MSTTRRSLSLDTAQYRRLEDRDGFFTPRQLAELLLRAYAAGIGDIDVDLTEGRKHQPGVRGRVLLELPDEVFTAAEAVAGKGRVSLLLDTLIAKYLAGEVPFVACVGAPYGVPWRALVTSVPPPPADATA
ncbi:hypothetical protein [Streptomyces chartreusis]|uniref:hypothetical protein n=1 Tax=Streptomyces chartreusis TaxID=1969 RepID=UPI0037FDE5DA